MLRAFVAMGYYLLGTAFELWDLAGLWEKGQILTERELGRRRKFEKVEMVI